MKLSVQLPTALATDDRPAPYTEAEAVLDRVATSAAPPEAAAVETGAPSALDIEARGADRTKPLAVFVTHGMGQQLPFATLDMAVRGIERALKRWTFGGRPVQEISVAARTVRLGAGRVQRLELDIRVTGADAPLHVHLYEAYWAPLTEGRVTLRDVMRFLVRGAWNGLRKGVGQPLERFMFGHNAIHGVQGRTFFGLLLTALVLGSLVLLNGVIGAVVVQAGYDVLADGSADTGGGLASALTTLVTAYLAVTLGFGFWMGVAAMTARYETPPASADRRRTPRATADRRKTPRLGANRRDALRLSTGRRIFLDVLNLSFFSWLLATLATGLLTLAVLLRAAGLDGLPALPFAVVAGGLVAAAVVGGSLSLSHGKELQERYREARERGDPFDERPLAGWKEAALWLTLTGAVGAVVLAAVVALAAWDVPASLAAGSIGVMDAQAFRLAVWFALFGVSMGIRGVIVQYFGDVAAYVSSHTLDRFAELRRAIREVATTLLHDVYHSRDPDGSPAYDGVVLVGHSLGSVVAYDALNRAITLDAAAHAAAEAAARRASDAPSAETEAAAAAAAQAVVDVVGRTKLLLTFGSPLDKTAYIFRAQNQSLSPVREALANVVQPLIQDVRYRAFPWINVHSTRDVIGSALDLYDAPLVKDRQRTHHDADHHADGHDLDPDRLRAEVARLHASVQPDGGPYCVHDIEDPMARVPLVAHNEHWETRAVWDALVATALAPALDAVAEAVATA